LRLKQLLIEHQIGYSYIYLKSSIDNLQNYELELGKYIQIVDKKDYMSFKKNIASFSMARPSYNFIYKSDKILNLFDIKNIREFRNALNKNIIESENIKSYYNLDIDNESLITYIYEKLKMGNLNITNEIMQRISEEFLNYYDGFINYKTINDEHPTMWADFEKIKNNLTLIDGMLKRFSKDSNIDIEFPKFVVDELKKYTNSAEVKMNKGVKEWLKTNLSKQYESKKIYRGFGLDIDDIVSYEEATIEYILKKIKKYIGLKNIEDIYVGNKILLSRGKESSWSTTPQIAKTFTMSLNSINFLVCTSIKPEQVIIDFTELSYETKKQFQFHGQNEVIVDTGKLSATISEIWVSKKMKKWLLDHGYDYIKNIGIIVK